MTFTLLYSSYGVGGVVDTVFDVEASVTTSCTASATCTVASTETTWTYTDINVSIGGSCSEVAGVITITSNGADINLTADGFGFYYKQVTGDATIVARINSQTNPNNYAKTGVMFRESLTAGSMFAGMFLRPGYGILSHVRDVTDDYATPIVVGDVGTTVYPTWVRTIRTGDLFTFAYSTNGVDWTDAGSATVPLSDTVYVGLANTSHTVGSTITAGVAELALDASGGQVEAAVSATCTVTGTLTRTSTFVNVAATPSASVAVSATANFNYRLVAVPIVGNLNLLPPILNRISQVSTNLSSTAMLVGGIGTIIGVIRQVHGFVDTTVSAFATITKLQTRTGQPLSGNLTAVGILNSYRGLGIFECDGNLHVYGELTPIRSLQALTSSSCTAVAGNSMFRALGGRVNGRVSIRGTVNLVGQETPGKVRPHFPVKPRHRQPRLPLWLSRKQVGPRKVELTIDMNYIDEVELKMKNSRASRSVKGRRGPIDVTRKKVPWRPYGK